MIIRLEQPKDWHEVENLTREAFWNIYRPGCTEHYVLNQYRNNPAFIPELDFVMEEDGKIIGHVSEPIGCIGYFVYGESNIKIGENDAEAGYWIARPYWNKGICTEALQKLIDHCFNEKGFQTLWSDFFPDNPASGRVMEKCGFHDTGEINYCSQLQLGSDRLVKIMRLDRK